MAPHMEPEDIGGPSEQSTPAAKTDNKKRKRKNEDEEEAAFILDDLESGERVLYLQEVPRVKASHCRAWNCMPKRRTREPIIRSYYRFALKGGSNLYGGERVEYYHITCLERIIPDLANLLTAGHLKMDGWIAAPPDSKITIESSTKAIQDWFQYEGRTFDIDCYESFRKDHEEWNGDWSLHQIEHQLGHTEKPGDGCYLCEGASGPEEPKKMDYFPEKPSAISLSRLLAIVSGQPHVDKWWRWREAEEAA